MHKWLKADPSFSLAWNGVWPRETNPSFSSSSSSSSLGQGTRLEMRCSLLTFIDMVFTSQLYDMTHTWYVSPVVGIAQELKSLLCGHYHVELHMCLSWSGKRLHVVSCCHNINIFVYIVQQSCHHCNLVPGPLPFCTLHSL